MADCPECEYCCVIGLCCPPADQLTALTALFVRETGGTDAECLKYAEALVAARKKAQKHPHGA